jgi:hypothetical protein
MKSLAVIVFIYLIVPGSGELIWDGLPLSTRAEFATLVALCIALTNRDVRKRIREWLGRRIWREALKPVVVLLALLKLLSFAWHPFSDGFQACYRSIYEPFENAEQCEKSYEGPFLRRNDFGFHNTTRIDRAIDFGVHTHDWSLPFMNEYPRMGANWLERFPFTVAYGATVDNAETDLRLVPIYSNGEVSGAVGASEFTTSALPVADQYEFPRLTLVTAPTGVSEFVLRYRFSEDDSTDAPDAAPPIRGKYATLKVGSPQSRDSILRFASVRIRGWTLNVNAEQTPNYVFAADESGSEIGRSAPQERPDVAQYVGKPDLTNNGFNFSIPARSLLTGAVSINASYDTETVQLAVLTATTDFVPALPTVELTPQPNSRSDLTVWFDAHRDDFSGFTPGNLGDKPPTLRILLTLLDLTSALLLAGVLLVALVSLRRSLPIAAILAAVTFSFMEIVSAVVPSVAGSRVFFPVIAITLLIVLVVRHLRPSSLFVFLPMAVVLAAYKSFDHLERFHTSKGQRWWGRLIFYWRDSDWYATQGYARTIFVEGSLRGGESLFWFQAGPRYLAFITRSLLGEQDALIGIIMTSLGFLAALILAARFLEKCRSLFEWSVGGCVLFVILFFMTDDLMAGFGFVGSSEYPTWIVFLIAAAFVISARSEPRAWPMVVFAVALGYSIQLRPNQIGGIVLMFIVMLLLVDRADTVRTIGTMSKMVASFTAVVLFSLWHNLYYGESFTPFTANAGINYEFSWLDVLGLSAGDDSFSAVWDQLRFMMYWNSPGNWSWTFMFWGAQLLWIVAIAYRYKKGLLFKAKSLLLLIPFGYGLPMLKYQMTSYYPRHLVVINLAFLLTALMAWPHSEKADEVSAAGDTDLMPSATTGLETAALSAPNR